MKKFYLLFTLLISFVGLYAQENLVSDGITRKIIVYAPKNLGTNRPLLISMHGMNQDANYQKSQANYESVADTAKFVVVYPDGIDRGWDLGGMRDINFITNIIDEMYKRYAIDRNRVYLSGFSMGGMMTYYAMTKIADKIAAFAPVSGYNMGGPNTNSSRPVPIFHVHGTGDDVCTYTPVQSHLDAWVKRNKCSTVAVEEKPKSGPSNTNARIFRYRNGEGGVEVAHLRLPDKGHWHSNDPLAAMTNVEIWNFCKNYSLTEGPNLISVTPEDNSFDMLQEKDNTFVLEFDKPVVCSKVKGNLLKGTTLYSLILDEKDESKRLTFHLNSYTKLSSSDYSLLVSGIESADGGKGANVKCNYTYGIEDVDENKEPKTIWSQDWYSQRDKVGEGCPYGWERVNSRSDGTVDKQTSGASNIPGARLKYFYQGGDFDCGFYLSARDFDDVKFTYGQSSDYPLTLPAGKYELFVPSIYWSQGSFDSKSTFSLSLFKKSDNKLVASSGSLYSSGCLKENANQKVSGSELHAIPFDLTAETKCLLQFSMSSGWNSVIIGEPCIKLRPSNAEIYKGAFMRAMSKARKLLEDLQEKSTDDSQLVVLRDVIEKYKDFSSISPSEYKAATDEIEKAMEKLTPLGIGDVTLERKQDGVYDLMGRRILSEPVKGLYIKNGKLIYKR